MQVTLSSYELCKYHHYKARVTVTDAGWWERQGVDRYSLSFAVHKHSKWCHLSTLKEAVCRTCDPKNGIVVRMSPAPLPSDCNSVEFNLTPVCTSTRSHIGSQIVLVIQGLPGLHLVSHPVTLLSRTSRRRQPISNQLTTNSELPSMPHGDFRLLLGIEDGQMFYECFSLLPQIAYRAEATAHPPNTLSFSKALRQMEEIQFTRPFIWVCIVRFKPEFEELHSVWLSCAGDFGIKPIAFQLSGGTSAVVKVFPSLV